MSKYAPARLSHVTDLIVRVLSLLTEYVTLSSNANGSRNATVVRVFEPYLVQRIYENRAFGFRSDITESTDFSRRFIGFIGFTVLSFITVKGGRYGWVV